VSGSVPAGTAQELSVSLRKVQAEPGSRDLSFVLDVAFTASAGITVLFGASGSGKTTILDCIAGLRQPDSGCIFVGETTLFDSQRSIDVATRQRHVGYLFQTLALFPHMSVRQNILYGLADIDSAERERRLNEIAASFSIDGLLNRPPSEISGGERQRTALARALVTRPNVLLLDEPMSALDQVTKGRILDDLRKWNEVRGVPILYVTHERREVYALADTVLVLEAGRLIAEGTPHDVLERPQYESVAQLAGFENIFDCTLVAHQLVEGTMSCRIGDSGPTLEVPFTRMADGQPVRVGVRAGDILVASSPPRDISARNVIAGTVISICQRDVTVVAEIDCGARFIVHLTPAAFRSLDLKNGKQVWLVIKTYSCRVLQ
jgi:molybdate transport system ATP-binding protein